MGTTERRPTIGRSNQPSAEGKPLPSDVAADRAKVDRRRRAHGTAATSSGSPAVMAPTPRAEAAAEQQRTAPRRGRGRSRSRRAGRTGRAGPLVQRPSSPPLVLGRSGGARRRGPCPATRWPLGGGESATAVAGARTLADGRCRQPRHRRQPAAPGPARRRAARARRSCTARSRPRARTGRAGADRPLPPAGDPGVRADATAPAGRPAPARP